jgi:hypothetical protein
MGKATANHFCASLVLTCATTSLCLLLADRAFAADTLLPPLAAPQPWPSAAATSHRSYLPSAVTNTPRLAEAARQQPLRLRPAADLPALAWSSGISLRAPHLTPGTSLARIASADAGVSPQSLRETQPDQGRPDIATDPAQDQVSRLTLASTPELRQKPAPFVRLAIPDPAGLPAVIGLPKPPPDNDAPVAVTDSPPRPVMQAEPRAQPPPPAPAPKK